MIRNRWRLLLPIALLATAVSCSSAYYNTMESFGYHKRDLLVDRVKEARDGQEEAKEQFASALEEFSALVGFQGGDLQAKYDALNREYERSVERADDVHERIASVRKVADALFVEWKKELDEYHDHNLRRSSEQQMERTRGEYLKLITVMEKAEKRMQPVLDTLHDNVLYIKHNLNAVAISSLEGTVGELESDVGNLLKDLEQSIAEANGFIKSMGIE